MDDQEFDARLDATDPIEVIVAEQLRRNHDVIERMVERMLVLPGNRGVLVTMFSSGGVQAELSDDVPFGEIHYRNHPGRGLDDYRPFPRG